MDISFFASFEILPWEFILALFVAGVVGFIEHGRLVKIWRIWKGGGK